MKNSNHAASGRYRGRFWAAIAAALLAAPASAAPPDLPPLWDSGASEQHIGKVVWRELVTPDLQGAEAFYGTLLGWTFRDAAANVVANAASRSASSGDAAPARHVVAMVDGHPVAGLLLGPAPSSATGRPAWLSFFSVADVDAAQLAAVAHGAKVLAQPRTYGRRGRQAVLADPQGAVFALFAPGTGGAPDEMAAPGEWIWASLLVRDADKDAAFYQDVFGYEVFDMPSPDGREHVVLSTDQMARASVNDLPDDSAQRHPHWLGFVRVFDVGETAARAQALGGRVIVQPHADRHGGQLAVVADPRGAVFGLMDWPESVVQDGTP